MDAHIPLTSVEGYGCLDIEKRFIAAFSKTSSSLRFKGNETSNCAPHDLAQNDAEQKLNAKPKFSPEQQTHIPVAGNAVLDPFGQCSARADRLFLAARRPVFGWILLGQCHISSTSGEPTPPRDARAYVWVGTRCCLQTTKEALYHYDGSWEISPPDRFPTDNVFLCSHGTWCARCYGILVTGYHTNILSPSPLRLQGT